MSLLIRTHSGLVAGGRSAGARHWLGIPYARAERFGLPLPPAPWSDTRAAMTFGLECPQVFSYVAAKRKIEGPKVGEACLVLNIWAPDTGDTRPRPVMVWIHGGAFTAGTGNLYDGAELAARGNIIVVTINYRLGVLGFVNLGEALELPEIASNLGMRDQIAALEWVRDNIAEFGGDREHVTIAGESAGSIAVSLLMHCQQAQPLFHGAIMQSGAINLPHSRERSLRMGHRYREILDLQRGDLSRLRSMDIKVLLHAQARIQAAELGTVTAAPWFDGELFPASLSAARAMPTASVPLLAGFNRDEMRTFELTKPMHILPITRAANERLIRQQLPQATAEHLLAAYADTRRDNRALATHLVFGMPIQHFAERHSQRNPTWFYRFDYSHPLIGAAHGLDLAFVWNFRGLLGVLLRGGLLRGSRRALSERMQQHWAHFVRHGRPGEDWLPYSAERRAVHLFDHVDQMIDDPDGPRRQLWNGADLSTSIC